METFSLPLHEINDRFTKSELYMVAWRSQEQHFHFKRKFPKKDGGEVTYSEGGKRRRYGPNDVIPEGLPDKFYAQDVVRDKKGKVMASPGEINLSQVSGQEAKRYMAAIGMPFPEIRSVQPKG